MTDIFISYAREDAEWAAKLARQFEARGWKVWWDPQLKAGERFDDVIGRVLEQASCVIVIWSSHSIQSQYVKDEASYALNRRKIFPVTIENVDLPFRFESLHTEELGHWDGSEGFPPLNNLITAVETTIWPVADGEAGGKPAHGEPATGLFTTADEVSATPEATQRGQAKVEPESDTGSRHPESAAPARSAPLSGLLKLAAVIAGGVLLLLILIRLLSMLNSPPMPASAPDGEIADQGESSGGQVKQPQVSMVRLPRPPSQYQLLQPVAVPASRPLRLVEVSSRGNKITDDEAWFERNGLTRSTLQVPNPDLDIAGELPKHLPRTLNGTVVTRVIVQGDYRILFFGEIFRYRYIGGPYIMVLEQGGHRVRALFDFSEYAPTQEWERWPRWAQVRDNILFVSIDDFITALNMDTGVPSWRSDPLVDRASNFVLLDAHIVSGHGGTGERDFLYILDQAEGHTVARLPLVTAPEYIVKKGEQLYVRAYNTDYVFRIGS